MVRISKYGYLRVHATKSELHAEVSEINKKSKVLDLVNYFAKLDTLLAFVVGDCRFKKCGW